jgi:hypothetical protein
MPLAKMCQHDTIQQQCPHTRSEPVCCIGAGRVMSTVRFLAILYVVQAGIGIALGFAYGVWLMYS